MPNTDKAGNLLPQNLPELERFIKAQSYIRQAANLLDELAVTNLSHLPKRKQDSFSSLAEELRDSLWETNSRVQDLMSDYFIPLFPIDTVNK